MPTSAAAKACLAALGLHGGNVAGLHIAEATFPHWSCRATTRPIGAATTRPIGAATNIRPIAAATTNIRPIAATTNIRPIAATTNIRPIAAPTTNIRPIAAATTNIRPIAAATNIRPIAAATKIRLVAAAEVRAVAAGAGLQDLIAAATPEIETCLTPIPDRIVAKPLLDVRIVIGHAAAMIGIVLPIVDVDIAIDVDVVVAPIATATPIIAPIGPASDGIANPKRHTRGDRRTGNISARWREVVWRVSGIRPRAINYRGIIVGHVDRIGVCGRDDNHLFAILLLG
jgi:hypothetical protein